MLFWRLTAAAVAFVIVGAPAHLMAQEPAEKPMAILLAAGDIARCKKANGDYIVDGGGKYISNGKDAETAALVRSEIDAAQAAGIEVKVLALGDLAYSKGTIDEFNKCFDNTWGLFKSYILPVPGNHDHKKGYFSYFKETLAIFDSGSPERGYYSTDVPAGGAEPWRLIGLNAYLRKGDLTAQNAWLLEDLQKSSDARQRCVLAFWHPPVFSSGTHGHGDCDGDDDECKAKVRSDAAPLCRPGNPSEECQWIEMMSDEYGDLLQSGASIALAGHDHNYEQLGRRNQAGEPDDRGIRSFVVGTGGTNLRRTFQYTDTWASAATHYSQDVHGILKISLYPGRYAWDFIPVPAEPGEALVVDPDGSPCMVGGKPCSDECARP